MEVVPLPQRENSTVHPLKVKHTHTLGPKMALGPKGVTIDLFKIHCHCHLNNAACSLLTPDLCRMHYHGHLNNPLLSVNTGFSNANLSLNF
jgi:hypothetical protein